MRIDDECEDLFALPTVHEEPKLYEKIGKVAFMLSFGIAISAFIPALLGKKRQIVLLSAPEQGAPQTVEVVEANQDLPPLLRYTEEEQRKIIKVFGTVAQGGWGLVSGALELVQLGKELDHIHPFALFLAMPKRIMQQIFTSTGYFKSMQISNTLRGIREGFERYESQIEPYTPIFAEKMGKDEGKIRRLIQEKDWSALAHYLFDIVASN